MAGRPYVREIHSDKPNHRINLPIEYPEDL